jgi:hypothetical protein
MSRGKYVANAYAGPFDLDPLFSLKIRRSRSTANTEANPEFWWEYVAVPTVTERIKGWFRR